MPFHKINQFMAWATLLTYPGFINNLIFTPILGSSNWEYLSSRKVKHFLSIVENLLIPPKGIQQQKGKY